ncbi:hypothetical protein, partial [Pseudomonas silesiensis]|uniref:hypothetical protein n=1 Tax=Pseudomonas silesiensis TaxID=1853130 RepID=UPI0034D70856
SGEYLITQEAAKKLRNEAKPIDFSELGADEILQIQKKETADVIDSLVSRSGSRTSTYTNLRNAQGKTDVKDAAVFRPVRANPKD